VDQTNGLETGLPTGGRRKHITSIKMKHRSHLNLEPDLILALTKIRARIKQLACQEQNVFSLTDQITLTIDKIFNQLNFAEIFLFFINFYMILLLNTMFWM
jgi:hypothetical protein